MKKTKRKKKIKLKYQTIFCTISIGFIIACILFYGGRFVYLYLDNNKKDSTNPNTLATVIKNGNNNSSNFVNINGTYYFKNDASNNYVKYSNMIWRIVKVDKNNGITLISDDIITNLAYGKNKEYNNSYIYKWLNYNDNEKNTGILEHNLHDKDKYLEKIEVCIDKKDKISNSSCQNTNNDGYIGILNIEDYVNTGADDSFVNNSQSFYLSGTNQDDENWFVTTDNKISSSDGEDILGIKPTIKLKNDITIVSGNGNENSPYVIEKDNGLFGGFVYLEGDTWRIYNERDNTIDMILTTPLKNEQIYANTGYKYDDNSYNSVAYYLNTTFLNNLTYKNIINETDFINGYYGSDNNYNYLDTFHDSSNIKTKVALPNIGDIIFYGDNNDFMTMTGPSKNGNLIYILNNKEIYSDQSKNKNKVIPVININKELLTKGTGSKEDPFEME